MFAGDIKLSLFFGFEQELRKQSALTMSFHLFLLSCGRVICDMSLFLHTYLCPSFPTGCSIRDIHFTTGSLHTLVSTLCRFLPVPSPYRICFPHHVVNVMGSDWPKPFRINAVPNQDKKSFESFHSRDYVDN